MQLFQNALVSVRYDDSHPSMPLSSPPPARKRKLADTAFEIADSDDDEDYGWHVEDEEAMPSMPPQWQGSEDLLIGTQRDSDDDDEDHADEPPEGQDENGLSGADADVDAVSHDDVYAVS